jgi:enolase
MEGEGKSLSIRAHGEVPRRARRRFPIISIEDGMAEDDWEGWKR